MTLVGEVLPSRNRMIVLRGVWKEAEVEVGLDRPQCGCEAVFQDVVTWMGCDNNVK